MAFVVVVEACLPTFLQAPQSCLPIPIVEQIVVAAASPVAVVEASAAPVELLEFALAVAVAEEVFVVLWLPEEQVLEVQVEALL